MMSKFVAMAAIVLVAASVDESMGAEQAAAGSQARAEERAKEVLAQQLEVAAESLSVMRSEPRQWNDSSMGCGKPGAAALTVITEGYVVLLSSGGKPYQVHVSNDNAVVCDKGTGVRRDPHGTVNARGLDVMMEKARQDLAARIGVDPAAIRLDGVKPQRFADSGMDCPADGETLMPGPVEGFLLSMKHDGRIYTYHTDRKTVRPCPRIEAQ
jgi:hypothetical protein